MPEPVLDPVLATLSYELIEMLRSFRDTPSFKELAIRFGRDERTVARQLLDVDAAFYAHRNVHILERETGRKNYCLTEFGVEFVAAMQHIAAATLSAVQAATTATQRVPVVCTANCLRDLRELRVALDTAGHRFNIVPLPRRSMEINLATAQPETEVCLLSALMSSEQKPTIGEIVQWNDHIEVLPLDVSAPQLLAVDDLGLGPEVTVREALEAGVTFLTPRGGVAWDFLERNFPDWTKLRPFQHSAVPDLDYGLRALATRAIPRSAMVVHGDAGERLGRHGIDTVRTHDFLVNGSHKLLAVTGIFHVRQEYTSGTRSPYDLVWKAAQERWSKKERIV